MAGQPAVTQTTPSGPGGQDKSRRCGSQSLGCQVNDTEENTHSGKRSSDQHARAGDG